MRLQYTKITQPYIIEAFYLADSQDEHIVDDIISIWTGLFPCNWGSIGTSHESRGVYVDNQLWFFSSTSRSELGRRKENGTRWIKAEELLRSPQRWELRKSPIMTQEQIQVEISRANGLLGRCYDFIGVVLDFLRPGILFAQRAKVYCSKACAYMRSGKMKRISPRRSWKKCKKQGYTVISKNDALKLQ